MNNLSLLPLPVYTFPSLISPWSEAIAADTIKWLEEDFNFLPEKMRLKYQLSNFGKISARCLPEMRSYTHLQVAARFMLWGTIFDDFYEFSDLAELKALHSRAIDILEGSALHTDDAPFFGILADIRDVLYHLMPAYWVRRFTRNVLVWIDSMQEEIPFKGVMHFPDLDYFMDLRERTIGVQAYLDLIEMQLDNILPDEVMYSDYMQELYRLAARVFAWCNDFYSLLKDVGREPLNLVLVLQHKYDLSLEDANAQALIIHDNDVACIVEMGKQMPDFGRHNASVEQFVHYLGIMVQGQNQWYQKDTMRYKKGGHPETGSFKTTS
ncbi:hypothetical protein SAMN05518672_102601 [Chitinophaga sp. CF118]|uniref:terpene synthase family protein n=2 Tax=Pseudomonadati TaxID=3379134 RepID=UPI0008E9C07D|nr:terpene synthase family protein [Chitinophaga sp. CF118]SFD60913.1 hypothetical protein SAMN05518672_102601 [Chitinophaga sp. CF118]